MASRRLTGLKNLQPNVSEERIFEARIAIQLNAGQVIYSRQLNRLYFHDSIDKRIAPTIKSVLSGLGKRVEIEPILIDEHRFIAVGHKLSVEPEAFVAVRTALRLVGVELELGDAEIIRRAGL